ncbi:MAG: A/G-specific adenine glycosylase [Candidatus Krumholzibacteria bacterium]|nr:A/G-specific adenine glycosylase [Candidatus Krumholzibacteria bacterium]
MKPDLPVDVFLPGGPDRFRSLLLSWFDRDKRLLPWRKNRSLYGTWISEVMLQQTTVTVVVPYWEKFMATFPDVHALAAAEPDEVLSLWSGLGYYRRARQLHQAAREVVSGALGKLPDNREGWLDLPGVGPYASGAIASIGLGIRVPALDSNARRVLTRWVVSEASVLDDLRPSHLERIGALVVDPERPGDWNEAVMELGALICRASSPRCEACPVRSLCRAGGNETADLIPAPRIPSGKTRVRLGLLVLAWRDRIMLMPPASGSVVVPAGSGAPVRPDVSGLHVGLWGLPSTPWLPDLHRGRDIWPGSIWRPWLESLPGVERLPGGNDPVLLGSFRHAITRYRLVVQVYGLRLPSNVFLDRKDVFQMTISRPEGGISVSKGGKQGTLAGTGFYRWPSTKQPVSKLVNKSLVIAANSIV